MILRKYQLDLIDATRTSFKNGKKRPLVVLPCGAGKTVCFADMASKHINKFDGGYVWFLVHRRELIKQTIDTFEELNIPKDNIFIGMVQTVTRNLEQYKTPSFIIFDEAHHAKAKTWYNIIEHFNKTHIIGLTATPERRDGKGLGDIFDDLIIGAEADWLIKNGYLSEYDYIAPPVGNMEFRMKGIDYDLDEFSSVLLKSKIYGDIEKYIDKNRKTIIYCPTIKFSQQLCEKIGATHFDGNTPKEERDEIIKKFKNGEIKILSNVDLIGEGFDVPDCEVIILLRPTQSLSLYIQQSMRGLRPSKGKRATIYDLVGNVYRHGMPTEHRDWSLDSVQRRAKNPSAEPDIIVRRCSNCQRVYSGTGRICPYCQNDNKQTRKEIEENKKIELEIIEKIEKNNNRKEIGKARTFEELVRIGERRGYKNPVYWANMIIKSRRNRNERL